MKLLLVTILSLGTLVASADEQLTGKKAIFKTLTSYNVGKIIAANESMVVVEYTQGSIRATNGVVKQKSFSRDEVGIEVKCLQDICKYNTVSTLNGRSSTRVDAIFDDGSILGTNSQGFRKRYDVANVIKH